MVGRVLATLLLLASVAHAAPPTLSKITLDTASVPRCYDITGLEGGHGLTYKGNGELYAGQDEKMFLIKLPKSGSTPVIEQVYDDGVGRTIHWGVEWPGRWGSFDWKGLHLAALVDAAPVSTGRNLWLRATKSGAIQHGPKMGDRNEKYLTWDGKYYYTGAEDDDGGVLIRKLRLDRNNFYVLREYVAPFKFELWGGLTFDGKYLNAIEWDSSTLYRFPVDGSAFEAFTYTSCIGKWARGLTYDGKYFFIRENAEDPDGK